MTWPATTAAALLLLVLVAAARRGDLLAALPDVAPQPLDDGTDEQGQGGAAVDMAAVLAAIDLWNMTTRNMSDTEPNAADNVAAFLAAIRKAEGTYGPDAYRTGFGGYLFTDMSDHPRRAVRFKNQAGATLWTTAAGAYQFMAVSPLPSGAFTKVNTWDRLRDKLGLTDFSPASQDAAAVELIREAGALGDVQAGRFDAAVAKVRRIWASLPGAGYAQQERSLAWLRQQYANAGGTFA